MQKIPYNSFYPFSDLDIDIEAKKESKGKKYE